MSADLIAALQNESLYAHPVKRFSLIETHISWVLLTGDYAYKIRKPVNFGFLDFTTLAQRQADCHSELALNRRLAAPLYDGLVTITGTPANPALGGSGPVIEYAVRMHQFDQQDLLSRRLASQALTAAQLHPLADLLARFHHQLPPATPTSDYGTPATVREIQLQNFVQIRPRLSEPQDLEQLNRLESRTLKAFEELTPDLENRRAQGFIREGHGDLHLGNIVWYRDQALPFDCIEFNPRFRWVDPLSDLAFLLMDLHYHNRPDLAQHTLNRYLDQRPDSSGLRLLRFYMTYRALVRAKITLLSSSTPISAGALARYRRYAALAARLSASYTPRLVLISGLSGSGKSWLAGQLHTRGWYRWLRSDIERKRLHLLPENRQLPLYGEAMTRKTYAQLLSSCKTLLSAGWSVIVDATFLEASLRRPFLAHAVQGRYLCNLIACQAPSEQRRQRIESRTLQGTDPSDATWEVAQRQGIRYQPVSDREHPSTTLIDTTSQQQVEQLLSALGEFS